MAGEQTRKPKPKKDEEKATEAKKKATDETKQEIDELLDEIDEVLESNAEDFIRAYVQKGGQAIQAIRDKFGSLIPSRLGFTPR
ncbi:MAG: ubiquitin-like protein Pup [Actinomycetota bacterium]